MIVMLKRLASHHPSSGSDYTSSPAVSAQQSRGQPSTRPKDILVIQQRLTEPLQYLDSRLRADKRILLVDLNPLYSTLAAKPFSAALHNQHKTPILFQISIHTINNILPHPSFPRKILIEEHIQRRNRSPLTARINIPRPRLRKPPAIPGATTHVYQLDLILTMFSLKLLHKNGWISSSSLSVSGEVKPIQAHDYENELCHALFVIPEAAIVEGQDNHIIKGLAGQLAPCRVEAAQSEIPAGPSSCANVSSSSV
ncbi:hypothetical protein BJX63DRAFT_429408 [Aspergillus granulosus]|uniref:Uncharacterized protein n=1 Tax=Aspergillus granulosus TaxID=176169 RepID=A0ABR4HRT3_9EURO